MIVPSHSQHFTVNSTKLYCKHRAALGPGCPRHSL